MSRQVDPAHIKICGITRPTDADCALDAGASAVGVLVGLDYDSPDQLTPQAAADIVLHVGSAGKTVMVTHRTSPDDVSALHDVVRSNAIQLHGAFPLTALDDLRARYPHVKLIKTIHVTGSDSVDEALAVAAFKPDAILLDSRTNTRLGGTGQVHDWSISRRIVTALSRQPVEVILAGGLNPDNIAQAIHAVRPTGVDVNSGVTATDGRTKSRRKLAEFVRRANATASGSSK